MDIKDFIKMAKNWFGEKNLLQKLIWILFTVLLVYEFFVTKTSYQLFAFLLFSVPTVLILDWVINKMFGK